jgi:citronellol/citronellal dehydrogenase
MTSDSWGRTDEELASLPLAFAPDLFRGKVVAISGAGSGIGRATAHLFARLGADLLLCGRSEKKLQEAAEGLARYRRRVVHRSLTIRDPEAVRGFVEEGDVELGGIDILVNNAGGQFAQPAIDFTAKGWNAVVDTNLNGTWYMMQAAARKWRETERPGVIVNVVAAVSRGMPGVAHSCAARAGVVYASKTAAIEWAPLGIRINCVAPGVIASEGMHAYDEQVRQRFPDSNPMRRFGQVEDIANAICYLAGPTGAFLTGEVLTVDGGNQLWGDQWTIPKPDWFRGGD